MSSLDFIRSAHTHTHTHTGIIAQASIAAAAKKHPEPLVIAELDI